MKPRSDIIDETGNRYGTYVVLARIESPGRATFQCRCDCGRERVIRGQQLRRPGGVRCECAVSPCAFPGCGRPCLLDYCHAHRRQIAKGHAPSELIRADRTIAERFWEKVDKNGPVVRAELGPCWVWTAVTNGRGYGQLRIEVGASVYTHRLSWEMANDQSVPDGLEVCHRCDNPPCVRPDHLFTGTVQDNARDMVAKGRHKAPWMSKSPSPRE